MKEDVIISLIPFSYHHMAWHMVLVIWWEISYGWVQLLSKTWPCLHSLNHDQMLLFWRYAVAELQVMELDITASQNNLGWMELQEVSRPTLCSKQGQLGDQTWVIHSFVQLGLENLQRWRLQNFSWQPVALFDWYIENCRVKFKGIFFLPPPWIPALLKQVFWVW